MNPGDLAAENQRLREQLMQAQRMVALGELVATATHEFNNVLMTIINYAKLGLRHQDAQTREKAFDKILAAGTRAARITNGVLGMARNRSSAKEPTQLNTLIEDTLLLLERDLNKHRVTVETHLEPVPPVAVNPGQIQQLLLNLVINARQAMPRGGRINLRLHYDSEAKLVELSIRDHGCGIPPEILPHIFEPFFTTKRGPDASGRGGTGLGLALCRQIVEAHEGRIRVESTPGVGTTFTVKLPVGCSATAPPSPVANPTVTHEATLPHAS